LGVIMMRMKSLAVLGSSALALAVLAGCGSPAKSTANNATNGTSSTSASTSNTSSSSKNQTVSVGAQAYQGKTNLEKYTSLASKQATSFTAQINAGVSEYQNHNYAKAIAYYKKAAAINPKSAVPYNDIGNVYRDMRDVKNAINYYTKATQADPTYGYGWLNLALAQVTNGDTSAAKTTVQKGLQSVKTSDPVHGMLVTEQKTLNK
jgi:tetratricopeptide (TPR) repeat protein